MLGKIIYISNNIAHVQVPSNVKIPTSLMNMHVIFEDTNKKVLGEIDDISKDLIKIRF